MKIIKLFIKGCLVITFTLGYSISFAQENDRHLFFTGELGTSTGLDNCLGACSASPSGTVGVGYSGNFRETESDTLRGVISLEHSNYRFNFNGNELSATRDTVNFVADYAFDEDQKYIFSLGWGAGWMTVSGPNSPSYTSFNPPLIGKILYQINPSLYLSLGYSHEFIVSANQPDFIANSVDFGFRWYL